MQQFIEKYKDDFCGVQTGFDRLVFGGSPRRLDYCYYDPARKIVVAKGTEEFLHEVAVGLSCGEHLWPITFPSTAPLERRWVVQGRMPFCGPGFRGATSAGKSPGGAPRACATWLS